MHQEIELACVSSDNRSWIDRGSLVLVTMRDAHTQLYDDLVADQDAFVPEAALWLPWLAPQPSHAPTSFRAKVVDTRLRHRIARGVGADPDELVPMETVERRYIERVRAATEGNKSRAVVAIMRTHLANNNIDRARAAIDDALAEDPDSLDLKFARAVLSGVEGDVDLARATMRNIRRRSSCRPAPRTPCSKQSR